MSDRYIDYLRKLYLKAEIDIINEIARLRSRGLVDYHAVAALKRVQGILKGLEDATWKYIPKIVERYFYVNRPELYTRAPKTVLGHFLGYINAEALSLTAASLSAELIARCLSELTESHVRTLSGLSELLIGRASTDLFRQRGLEAVGALRATGLPVKAKQDFVETLRRDGVTAFTDKAGRNWSLHAYADMVIRTTARQADTLAVLEKIQGQDLYQISQNGSSCPVCAPFEGRVFSKSGESEFYPPLADAYGKRDPAGPNTLDNTWLTIHPNCRHVLLPFTEAGLTPEEIKRIRAFSSPKTNPYTHDPRSEAQIEDYRRREREKAKLRADIVQFEKYRLALPEIAPRSYDTFMKHKALTDEKYKAWQQAYRKAVKDERERRV